MLNFLPFKCFFNKRMSNSEVYYSEYFKFLNEVTEFWRSMQDRSPALLGPLFNQTEQLRLCSRAQLDDQFLLKFPDAKERLLVKINLCIEEEMSSIFKVQEEIKTYSDGLKTRLNSIEKANEKLNTDEEREFNPLIPNRGKLLELAIDMWKCFHLLWLGVKTSFDALDYYSEDSIKSLSEAFKKYNKMEKHFKYVTDLTRYLRTSMN